MTDQKLIDYIHQCREFKISDEDIVRNLLSVGWSHNLIDSAFAEISLKFAAAKEILIAINNLSKEYELSKNIKTPALKNINLDIYKGEFLSITGHSGSGKTTLLNLIGLIDFPTSGEILVNNENIHKFKEKEKVEYRLKFAGFIFQFFNLLDNYTALENIIFQLRLQGYGRRKSKEKAKEILKFLGLETKANSYPKELSGGEQQRAAVGRALAKDSFLILADEPAAHLDSKNTQNLISLLREVNVKFKKTIILVTHELNYAKQADRTVELKDGAILEILQNSSPHI